VLQPSASPFPTPCQVVTGKQWVLEAVGEIILRSWREATGPCAAAIETTLIQVGRLILGGPKTRFAWRPLARERVPRPEPSSEGEHQPPAASAAL
jgi:hypothetical protein